MTVKNTETEIKQVFTPMQFYDALKEGQQVFAQHISHRLRDEIKCISYDKSEQIYVWNNFTKLWEIKNLMYIRNEISAMVVDQMKQVKNEIGTDDMEKLTAADKWYKKCQTDSFCKSIATFVCVQLNDQLFKENLDMDPDVLNFKNGVYDLRKNEFRERVKSDYATLCLQLDYSKSTQKEMDMIRDIFHTISNCNDLLTMFSLDFFGTCLSGRRWLSNFLIACGHTASNGKSTLAEIFEICLSFYCHKFNSKTFDLNFPTFHKQISSSRMARFAYIEELSSSKLDVSRFKEVITASALTNEVMYGTTEKIKVFWKFYASSNKDLRFESDEGILRRGLQINNTNKFVDNPQKKNEFKKDIKLKDKFNDDKNKLAFINLLIQHCHKMYKNVEASKPAVDIPAEVVENFKAICEQNDKIVEFLDNYYDITEVEDDVVSKFEFTDKWQAHFKCHTGWDRIISDVKKKGLLFDSKKRCIYFGNSRQGVICGLKEKSDIDFDVNKNLDDLLDN